MAVNLSSLAGAGWQFFDDNGNPLTGGKIYTYLAGTTTPATTYTSVTGATPHTNPIILDAAGRVPEEIWLTVGLRYKFIIKTSTDVLIGTYDNISGFGGVASIANFTGTGSQTTFALAFVPVSENGTDVYINGVYQQKNTYSLSLTDLIFSEAPPYSSTIEVMYT